MERLDKKYENYIVEGFTGIEFWLDDEYNSLVENLLDDIIKIYPDFKIYQLKVKFGMIRFYTNLPSFLEGLCENTINDAYKSFKKRNEEQETNKDSVCRKENKRNKEK